MDTLYIYIFIASRRKKIYVIIRLIENLKQTGRIQSENPQKRVSLHKKKMYIYSGRDI